ncbi:MAG TPA: cytochrome b/b6 domain-containing protein [Terriglobales bacterium]|nr:cytochrome b/b6 domain-containing protein [Terriglobales bacterium]
MIVLRNVHLVDFVPIMTYMRFKWPSILTCYACLVSARGTQAPRHSFVVRATHWITVISFVALLITGVEILISHPRFYWGEVGNSSMTPLFKIPIASSRSTVPTGYNYVLPDQNGWSRYLHFEAAWALILTGSVYFVFGLWTRHFRKNLFPAPSDRTWEAFRHVIAKHLRLAPSDGGVRSYNVLQRTTYLLVVFLLFPLVVLTGLAMSPAFNSAIPWIVNALGGRQSARTLHFLVSISLVLFLLVHVLMIALTGFVSRMREMITGFTPKADERT